MGVYLLSGSEQLSKSEHKDQRPASGATQHFCQRLLCQRIL